MNTLNWISECNWRNRMAGRITVFTFGTHSEVPFSLSLLLIIINGVGWYFFHFSIQMNTYRQLFLSFLFRPNVFSHSAIFQNSGSQSFHITRTTFLTTFNLRATIL